MGKPRVYLEQTLSIPGVNFERTLSLYLEEPWSKPTCSGCGFSEPRANLECTFSDPRAYLQQTKSEPRANQERTASEPWVYLEGTMREPTVYLERTKSEPYCRYVNFFWAVLYVENVLWWCVPLHKMIGFSQTLNLECLKSTICDPLQ